MLIYITLTLKYVLNHCCETQEQGLSKWKANFDISSLLVAPLMFSFNAEHLKLDIMLMSCIWQC